MVTKKTKKSKFSTLKLAEQANKKQQQSIQECVDNLNNMFNDRSFVVTESVVRVLNAVQNKMSAGEDPTDLVSPQLKPSLIELLAGAVALQKVGAGQDTMALKTYIERIKGERQNLSPDQLEIAAIKTAGRESSSARQYLEKQLNDFSAAIQQGDQQTMDKIRSDFFNLLTFYQQVHTKVLGNNTSNQQSMGQTDQQPMGQADIAGPQKQPSPPNSLPINQ